MAQNLTHSQRVTNLLLSYQAYKRAPNDRPFTLASGAQSVHYIDVRPIGLTPNALYPIATMIAEVLSSGTFGPVATVAGVVLGGCAFATGVSMLYRFRNQDLPTIYVRTLPKDHGMKKLVELPAVGSSHPTSPTVLIEDVVTSGKSSLTAAAELEAAGIQVAGILAIVDRREDRAPTLGKYRFHALTTFAEVVQGYHDLMNANDVLPPT